MLNYILNHTISLIFFLAIPSLVLGHGDGAVDALQIKLSKLDNGIKKVDVLNELGKLTLSEKYELAGTYNEKALALAKQIIYQKGIGEAKRNLSIVALKTGKKDKAIELLDQALIIARQNNYQSLEASTLWSLGYYWQRVGDFPTSIKYLLESKALCLTLKDDYWLSKCYIQLGWAYFGHGEITKAESYFKQGVTQSEKSRYVLPEALYGIAGFYLNRNINYYQVNTYLNRGIKIAKENNQPRHVAQLQTTIGGFHYNTGQNEKAKVHYLAALEYFESNNFYANMVWLYGVLGNLALQKDDYDVALGYFNSALSYTDKVDNADSYSSIFIDIGNIYNRRDQAYNKALEFYQKGLDMANKGGTLYTIRSAEISIGVAYLKLEKYKNAVQWCKKGLIGTDHLMKISKDGCKCLATAYDKLGKKQQALKYYKQLDVLKDSLHKDELSIQASTLEIRDNYEKELIQIKQKQTEEKQKNNTRMAMIIGGLVLIFMIIIMFLSIAYVKKIAQKNQLLALANLRKELIANVSHDLRTPISVMQGYVETLLIKINTSSLADREKYLNIILNSSQRLSLLIGQLFEFSTLDTQQLEPHKEPFQINELLRSSLEEYQVLANKKGVQFKMNCPENATVVYADISLIERVIQNLIDNALKFSPEKGIIEVCVSKNTKSVEVSIADHGCGIDSEQQALIFNRFEKSKKSEGAGLGLAIVKKILEMHESFISVKSEVGRGTKFIFSLPTYEI